MAWHCTAVALALVWFVERERKYFSFVPNVPHWKSWPHLLSWLVHSVEFYSSPLRQGANKAWCCVHSSTDHLNWEKNSSVFLAESGSMPGWPQSLFVLCLSSLWGHNASQPTMTWTLQPQPKTLLTPRTPNPTQDPDPDPGPPTLTLDPPCCHVMVPCDGGWCTALTLMKRTCTCHCCVSNKYWSKWQQLDGSSGRIMCRISPLDSTQTYTWKHLRPAEPVDTQLRICLKHLYCMKKETRLSWKMPNHANTWCHQTAAIIQK